jgi:hypothetical protein
MDACRQALLAHNIWLSQYPVPVEPGHLGLVTKLTHADSGQWQSSLLVMPLPKADPQGYGSALTYGRRYGLAAMVGIVTEDDDDGNAATDAGGKRKRGSASLPKLDGIDYDTRKTQDNRLCTVATGKTANKEAMLEHAGFKWNAQRQIWWKYTDAA